MKAELVVISVIGMLTTYGVACLHAGINHDISMAVISGMTGAISAYLGYLIGKKKK